MAKEQLKEKKIKSILSKKIFLNPFTTFRWKALKISKLTTLTIIFLIVSLFFVRKEKLKNNQKVLGLQTKISDIQKEVFGWEQILAGRPDYRDGWLNLSIAYEKLGDRKKAVEALQKAKLLDPTNKTIIFLENLLGAESK